MCPFGWRASLLRCLLVLFSVPFPLFAKDGMPHGIHSHCRLFGVAGICFTRRVKNGQSAEILAQTLISTSRCCFFSFPLPFPDSTRTLLRSCVYTTVAIHLSLLPPSSSFEATTTSLALWPFFFFPPPRELTVPLFFSAGMY
ncbi:hypothetical protein J3E68DRAFT_390364, partial [Trichoderma sp. SZMC 28012]